MKLLLEILGMTSYCNLSCGYCEWKKAPVKALGPADYGRATANIRTLGEIMRQRFPSVAFVEYSGGEPLLYPPVFEAILDTFADRWIRLSTNGVLVDDAIVARMAGRKAYAALSLDGSTAVANAPRFKNNEALLPRVLTNVDKLLAAGVPVMLLCTINKHNIEHFEEYVRFLDRRYAKAIDDGMLMLPAHCVSEFDRAGAKPTFQQALGFEAFVRARTDASPLTSRIAAHYRRLADFICASTYEMYREMGREQHMPGEWQRRYNGDGYRRTCFLYDWQVAFHFLDDAIAASGQFRGWGCGMRGIESLGDHPIDDREAVDRYLASIDDPARNRAFRHDGTLGRRCPILRHCFVDWNVIDMLFAGQISLSEAQRWSVIFRDPVMAAKALEAQRLYGAPDTGAMDAGAIEARHATTS